MTGSFSILLSMCNHPLSIIASKFLSFLAKYFFRAQFINGTISHWPKSVLSNACLCLKCKRAYFYTVMAIFQNKFWWQLSPTWQTSVALGVPRLNIHFLCSSGVEELIYSRNGNWSLLPWPSNNPKEVGPSWCRSKTLSWSKYLSPSVSISYLIDPLRDMHIKPGINSPLNLWTGNPGSDFPSPMFSSMVLLESYGILTW